MNGEPTRVRTQNGVLVVDDHQVRLERGGVLPRTLRSIGRPAITHIRLTSRFNGLPVALGALLVAGALTLLISADPAVSVIALPAFIVQSAAIALFFAGGLLLLSLPVTWRAVLVVASDDQEIRVHTGFRRRHQLELALGRLQDGTDQPRGDLIRERVNTPSGSRPESG